MSFEKKLITENDVKEFKKKFDTLLYEDDAFVINTERDCLLHNPRQDRRDMGGTTNTYWHFTYKNKNYVVACGIGRTREEKNVYYIPIISIKENNSDGIELLTIDKGFISNFSLAYDKYEKYDDLDPTEKTDDFNDEYKFEFVGQIS